MNGPAKPPFMIDQDHIQLLDGQSYIVIRPTEQVVSFYKNLQKELLSLLSSSLSSVSYPNYPHVTMRGFPEGADLEVLRQVVKGWVKTIPPLQIRTRRLGYFPDPYRVILFEVDKNKALVDAYDELSIATAALPQLEPQRSSDQWTFHISILYGKNLPDLEWENLVKDVKNRQIPTLECRVDTVELVSYDDGKEKDEEFRVGQGGDA